MIGSFFEYFAATDGIHVSLRAEPIAKFGSFIITNSMLYGLIIAAIIAVIMVWSARSIKVTPRKNAAQIIEVITEFILSLAEGVFGSRAKAVKYTPIFGVFFFFIILNNLSGLLPVVGPGLAINYEGVETPIFRPFTADLNGTIAMSLTALLIVQFLSIKAQGGKGHLKHYFSDKPLNPINFFIGVLEVFGELTRLMSLSLRLFLNTAVGEILIAVFTSLVLVGGRTPIAVIPIILFEVLVAGIQAYVFTVLSATYLGLAIAHAHEHGSEDEHHELSPAKKVEGTAS